MCGAGLGVGRDDLRLDVGRTTEVRVQGRVARGQWPRVVGAREDFIGVTYGDNR